MKYCKHIFLKINIVITHDFIVDIVILTLIRQENIREQLISSTGPTLTLFEK